MLNINPLIAKTKVEFDILFEQYMKEIHPNTAHNSREFAVLAECYAAAQLILMQYQNEHPDTPLGILIPVLGIRSRQQYLSAQKRFSKTPSESNGTDNSNETPA